MSRALRAIYVYDDTSPSANVCVSGWVAEANKAALLDVLESGHAAPTVLGWEEVELGDVNLVDNIESILDKLNDILDKCNDIFEKLEE